MKLANQGKRWTDSDNNMLRNMMERDCKPEFMAEALGRTVGSVYSQTYKLRLADRKAESEEWLHQTGSEEEQLEIDIVPPADSYVVNEPVDKLGEIERMPLDTVCDKIDALTEYVGGVNSKLVTMTIGMVALLVLFIVAFAY